MLLFSSVASSWQFRDPYDHWNSQARYLLLVHLTAVSPITLCLFYKEKSNDAEMEAWFGKLLNSPIAKEQNHKALQENIINLFPIF